MVKKTSFGTELSPATRFSEREPCCKRLLTPDRFDKVLLALDWWSEFVSLTVVTEGSKGW